MPVVHNYLHCFVYYLEQVIQQVVSNKLWDKIKFS